MRRSREEQALEFLNLWSGTLSQQRHQPSRPRRADVRARFAAQLFLFSIACPALYCLLVLPQDIDTLGYTFGTVYYWSYHLAAVSFFGRETVRVSWGATSHWCTTLVLMATMVATQYGIANVAEAIGNVLNIVPVLCCIYFPTVCTVWRCVQRGEMMKESLGFLVFMLFGCLPFFTALALYNLTRRYGWGDSVPLLMLQLLIWTLLPMFMRCVAISLSSWSAPANRALAPLLVTVYVEAIFSCMGMLIFMQGIRSALGYVLAYAGMVLLQIARGSRTVFSLTHRRGRGSLRLHRFDVFIKTFIMLACRIASYVLFLSYGLKRCILRSMAWRPAPRAYLLFQDQLITPMSVLALMACIAIATASFLAFVLLIPRLWCVADAGKAAAEVPGPAIDSSNVELGAQDPAYLPEGDLEVAAQHTGLQMQETAEVPKAKAQCVPPGVPMHEPEAEVASAQSPEAEAECVPPHVPLHEPGAEAVAQRRRLKLHTLDREPGAEGHARPGPSSKADTQQGDTELCPVDREPAAEDPARPPAPGFEADQAEVQPRDSPIRRLDLKPAAADLARPPAPGSEDEPEDPAHAHGPGSEDDAQHLNLDRSRGMNRVLRRLTSTRTQLEEIRSSSGRSRSWIQELLAQPNEEMEYDSAIETEQGLHFHLILSFVGEVKWHFVSSLAFACSMCTLMVAHMDELEIRLAGSAPSP